MLRVPIRNCTLSQKKTQQSSQHLVLITLLTLRNFMYLDSTVNLMLQIKGLEYGI